MKKLLILLFWPILGLTQPISQFPPGTLPLTGTEPVPVVQGGINKQVPSSAFFNRPLGPVIYSPQLYGQFGNATGISFISNDTIPPAVMGATPSQLAAMSFAHTETVGLYSHILAPPPAAFTVGSYNQTTFTPTTPYTALQLAQMHVGMFVLTCSSATSPCPDANFFWGQATAFSANSITVSGWFQQGNGGAGQNPSSSYCINAVTCYAVVSPIGAIWSVNTACRLTSTSYADTCYGYELDMHDTSGVSTHKLYGFDVVNQGNVTALNGFMATSGTNGFNDGFHFYGAAEGFLDPVNSAFRSSQLTGDMIQNLNPCSSGNYVHTVTYSVFCTSGTQDLGSHSATSSPQIRLHDSGNSGPDVTVSSSGGTGANDGTATISASSGLVLSGPLQEPVGLFAGLGSCAAGNKGQAKIITDGANTPTFGATTTGGGATLILAICNGTNWTNH